VPECAPWTSHGPGPAGPQCPRVRGRRAAPTAYSSGRTARYPRLSCKGRKELLRAVGSSRESARAARGGDWGLRDNAPRWAGCTVQSVILVYCQAHRGSSRCRWPPHSQRRIMSVNTASSCGLLRVASLARRRCSAAWRAGEIQPRRKSRDPRDASADSSAPGATAAVYATSLPFNLCYLKLSSGSHPVRATAPRAQHPLAAPVRTARAARTEFPLHSGVTAECKSPLKH
jgi:hypothetical protein